MNNIALIFLKIYKSFVSPILPGACRFSPTCSEYSIQAFQNYGFFTALYLTVKRILRCNPFFSGYFDPLPIPTKNCKHKDTN